MHFNFPLLALLPGRGVLVEPREGVVLLPTLVGTSTSDYFGYQLRPEGAVLPDPLGLGHQAQLGVDAAPLWEEDLFQ